MTAGGHNRLPESIRTRGLRMLKDGYTIRQIARKLDVSESVVRKWKDHRKIEQPQELAEGIRMLQAWPRRAAATVRGVSGNEQSN